MGMKRLLWTDGKCSSGSLQTPENTANEWARHNTAMNPPPQIQALLQMPRIFVRLVARRNIWLAARVIANPLGRPERREAVPS